MSTTTTTSQTLTMAGADATPRTAAQTEPEVLVRERAGFHDVLRLVAERAEAEASVEASFKAHDTAADSEYQKARRALLEKFDRLESEARSDDEKRRRAVIDAAIRGEADAKAEFAAASRRIATLFDSLRETARSDNSRAKSEAAAAYDSGLKTATKQQADQLRPIDDSAGLADSYRQRLATLAVEYRKFGLDPEPPAPRPNHTTSSPIQATSCSHG